MNYKFYEDEEDITVSVDQDVPVRASQIPGKGIGLIATRLIKEGELIFKEKPIVDTTDSKIEPTLEEVRDDDVKYIHQFAHREMSVLRMIRIRSVLENLDDINKSKLMQLRDAFKEMTGNEKTLFGCFITNAVTRGYDSSHSVVGALASRLNHSCIPNVGHFWTPPYERIVAMRDIPEDTELCTCYIDAKDDRDNRCQELISKYRFECCCEACSLNGDVLVTANRRRLTMKLLDPLIPQAVHSDPKKGFRIVESILYALKSEGLLDFSYRARYCYNLYQFACGMKDLELAKKYIKDAYDATLITEGPDSDETMKKERYMKAPTSHYCWGLFS